MVRAIVLVLLIPLSLAGCGYAPPPSTDVSAPAYKADYAACDASVPEAVNKRNAKTGHAWISSPITRWGMIDDGMNACMAEKGWGRVRSCTAEELRDGTKRGAVTVTARGIQCTDPGVRRG